MEKEVNAVLSELWPETWKRAWEKDGKLPKHEVDKLMAQDRELRRPKTK